MSDPPPKDPHWLDRLIDERLERPAPRRGFFEKLIEYFTDTVFPRIRNMGYVAVRSSRHKYINYRELQGMDELYDLDTDPYEETNIIDRPGAQETLQKMKAELQRLIEQTSYAAPAPTVKPVSR